MLKKIKVWADRVLMVCTEKYQNRVDCPQDLPAGVGRGVMWEADVINSGIYDNVANENYIPIVLKKPELKYVPVVWRERLSKTYCIATEYADLVDNLTDDPDSLSPLPRQNRHSDRFKQWNVPYPKNVAFVNSGNVIGRLHDLLHETGTDESCPTVAILGPAGSGKTCVVAEYAHQFFRKNGYLAVFWIHAESEATIRHGFADIAQTLELKESRADDQEVAIQAAKRWLDDHPRWLLVFDNVDDSETVLPHLPVKNGHVIVISRDADLNRLATSNAVTLGRLSVHDAEKLLKKRSGRNLGKGAERAAAKTLVQELAYLPLALEQAGAVIEAKGWTFAEYLNKLRD